LKIVVAGDWHSQLHEEAMLQALRQLGHEVVPFAWHGYFLPGEGALSRFDAILKKGQNKCLAGPILRRINRDLLALAARERPRAIFVYRGTHVFPTTLRKLRVAAPGAAGDRKSVV